MKTSEQINEIAKAIAAAQAEISNPEKGKENPHFKSWYADLASGLNATRTLSQHGVAVTQTTRLDGDIVMLETRLSHSSGQWIEGDYPVYKFPAPAQQAVGAMTYARRAALFAIAGIAGEDDDGNEAAKMPTPAPARKTFVRAVQDKFPGAREPVRDEIPFQDAAQGGDLSPSISEYVGDAMNVIETWSNNAVALWDWWKSEAVHREAVGIKENSTVFNELYIAMSDKGKSIKARDTK